MKIDFSKVIFTLKGAPMKGPEGGEFTLREAACAALDGNYEDDRKATGKEKYYRGHLSSKIYGAKEPVNLNADDLKMVKDFIARAFGPHIVKEAWDLLDPPEEAEKIN